MSPGLHRSHAVCWSGRVARALVAAFFLLLQLPLLLPLIAGTVVMALVAPVVAVVQNLRRGEHPK